MKAREADDLLVFLRGLTGEETGDGDAAITGHLELVRQVLGAGELHFWLDTGEEEWWGFSVYSHREPAKGRVSRSFWGTRLEETILVSSQHLCGSGLLLAGGEKAFLVAYGGEAGKRACPEGLLEALLAGLRAQVERVVLGTRLARAQSDLRALGQISRVISSTADFSVVLGQCIEQMKNIIGAEAGGVLLYDPQNNKLVLQRPAFGVDEAGFRGYSLDVVGEERAGMGAAVRVFITGRPYICNTPAEDPISNRQIIELYGVRRSLTVPLEVDNRRLGVLHLINKRSGDFTQEDARLASLLASQLAVVIENARLFSQLETKNRLLQRAIEIHDQLTQMVLQGKGIDTITVTLAQLLGRPVQIADQYLRPVAFAVPPDTETDPFRLEVTAEEFMSDPEVQDFLARLQKEQRPLPFPNPQQHGLAAPRIMAPIKVGGETFGYVSVLVAGRDLEEMDLVAVEHGATVIALKFMQQKVACEVEERIRGRFVEDLVYGRIKDERDILERARYLGYDPRHFYHVMIIQAGTAGGNGSGGGTERGFPEPRAAMLDLVRRCAADWGCRAIAARTSPLLVLVDSGFAKQERKVEELAAFIREKLKVDLGEPAALVCVGGPARGVQQLQLSYRQAEMALQMARRFGWRDAVVPYSSLGIFRVFLHVENQRVLAEYVKEVLGPLLAYDRDKNGNLLSTLKAYIESNFNYQRTAERLFIHLNTLKYRLQRIRDIGRLDLDDPEQRLNVQLAVKMLDVLDIEPGGHSAPAGLSYKGR